MENGDALRMENGMENHEYEYGFDLIAYCQFNGSCLELSPMVMSYFYQFIVSAEVFNYSGLTKMKNSASVVDLPVPHACENSQFSC